MAKTRAQKEKTVQSLKEAISSSTSAVFANIQGLTVKETQDLKKKAKQDGVYSTMIKKTLLKKVLSDIEPKNIDPKKFQGGIGVFYSKNDPISAPKIVENASKVKDIVKIFGGIFEGKFIEPEKVQALAKLPGRIELLTNLAYDLQYPVSSFVRVLAGNLKGLATVLDNIAKSKI